MDSWNNHKLDQNLKHGNVSVPDLVLAHVSVLIWNKNTLNIQVTVLDWLHFELVRIARTFVRRSRRVFVENETESDWS